MLQFKARRAVVHARGATYVEVTEQLWLPGLRRRVRYELLDDATVRKTVLTRTPDRFQIRAKFQLAPSRLSGPDEDAT